MAIHVEVQDIVSPRHLTALVSVPGTPPNPPSPANMEVYTGWVTVNHNAGGATVPEEALSFVMLDTQFIQPYNIGEILDITVMVAPSSVADDDDEANVAAVNRASVVLEPQTFGGVAGNPNCLVLRARLGAHHANVISITYQVTVLARMSQLGPIKLAPTDKPQ